MADWQHLMNLPVSILYLSLSAMKMTLLSSRREANTCRSFPTPRHCRRLSKSTCSNLESTGRHKVSVCQSSRHMWVVSNNRLITHILRHVAEEGRSFKMQWNPQKEPITVEHLLWVFRSWFRGAGKQQWLNWCLLQQTAYSCPNMNPWSRNSFIPTAGPDNPPPPQSVERTG